MEGKKEELKFYLRTKRFLPKAKAMHVIMKIGGKE